MGQIGFFDVANRYASLDAKNDPLRIPTQSGKRFGDQAYAVEELVAELGAAFLCADLGITNEPRADHAAYIATWLDVLKADKKAIFTAASQAARATDFLASLQSRRQEVA